MRLTILLIAMLITFPAIASTFVSENEVEDVWAYVFTVKNGLVGTPLNIAKYMCNGPINHRTGKPLFPVGTKCFNTESEARVEAQKEADKFEADKTVNGESTTAIEAKRMYYSGINKLNGN